MIKTDEVKALVGARSGMAALEFDLPGAGDVGVASGIILEPTPGEWSMFPWRLEVVELCQGYQLSTKVYEGFVAFSNIVGTPDARFGTGLADPGYSSTGSGNALLGIGYGVLNDSGQIGLKLSGAASRPISVGASGEVTLYYTSNSAQPAYAKAVLYVGAEVILPFEPAPTP